MRRPALALAALLMPSMFVLLPATAHAADEMSEAQAGRFYMKAYCKAEPASVSFYKTIWGSDDTFYADEFVGKKKVRIKKVAKRMAKADYRFARKISNPPSAWPSTVRSQARSIAKENVKLSRIEKRLARARTGSKAIALLDRYNVVVSRVEDDVIELRLELDLPDSGGNC